MGLFKNFQGEELNPRPSDSVLLYSTTEPQRLNSERSLLRIYMTRVLHTVRISNGDSVMYVNKIREMVSLELGKEIEKDVLRLVTSVEQRKNSEFP